MAPPPALGATVCTHAPVAREYCINPAVRSLAQTLPPANVKSAMLQPVAPCTTGVGNEARPPVSECGPMLNTALHAGFGEAGVAAPCTEIHVEPLKEEPPRGLFTAFANHRTLQVVPPVEHAEG